MPCVVARHDLKMKQLFLSLIRLYQKTSFFSGRDCRFTPTCSEYCYQAVDKYGIIKGLWLGLKRIVRCHPWSKGGEDGLK